MGWLASAILFLGAWLIGGRRRCGFAATVIGEAMWVWVAATRREWDLAVVCVVFGGLAAANWWRWRPAREG